MRHENTNNTKLSWSKRMVRKFFNIKTKTKGDSHQTYGVPCGGVDIDCRSRSSLSEREPCTIKKSKTEKFTRNSEQPRCGKMNLDHPRIIDVHNYNIFGATWNVAGRSPPSNLSIDDWQHALPPADIYVLGFQEIVPLNAGNILGAEHNGPAKKWLALVIP